MVPCWLSSETALSRLMTSTLNSPSVRRTQIFIGGDFIGGASELLDLMGQGKLSERLDAAEGKGAFPDDIATLISQRAPKDAPAAVDEEIQALKKSLKDNMPRSAITATYASRPKKPPPLRLDHPESACCWPVA